MDIPGVPTGRYIVRGAVLGAAAGMALAFFTRSGSSIDLGVLVGVSLELVKAWIRGDLKAPTSEESP